MNEIKFYKQKDGSFTQDNKDNGNEYLNEKTIEKLFVYDVKNKQFLSKEGKMNFEKFLLSSTYFNLHEFGGKIATFFYDINKYDLFIPFEDLLKNFNPMDLRTTAFKETIVNKSFISSMENSSEKTLEMVKRKAIQSYQSLFKNYPVKTLEDLKKYFKNDEEFYQSVKKHLQIDALLDKGKIYFLNKETENKITLKKDKMQNQNEDLENKVDAKMQQIKQLEVKNVQTY